jgi:hypothetical protein
MSMGLLASALWALRRFVSLAQDPLMPTESALGCRGVRAADLPEQSLACQEESRRQITGPRRVDPDLYRRMVDRRRLYLLKCMVAGPLDIEQTGSISVPLPPEAADRLKNASSEHASASCLMQSAPAALAARAAISHVREGGDPFAAREQVFRTRHP